jgi:hypothetical protein
MVIETKPGYIFLSLEDVDFRRRIRTGQYAWREALEHLKEDIHPDERSYDADSHIWMIKDTLDNRTIIKVLKDIYFTDQNQTNMF